MPAQIYIMHDVTEPGAAVGRRFIQSQTTGGTLKFRLGIAMLIGLVLMFAATGLAGAQSLCDTIESDGTGAPGDPVTICGTALQGDTVTAFFDGVEVGSAVADEYDQYCITFNVPADAQDGEHELAVLIEGEGTAECSTPFVVAGASQPPVEVVTAAPAVAMLPATGLGLLPLGAAFASAGLGAVMVRRRRR